NLIGDDVQVVDWGDGSAVPTSGQDLVIVGLDTGDVLHIRSFDADGNATDTTEPPLTGSGVIPTLEQQIPGWLPPHALTLAEKAQIIAEVRSIVGSDHLIAATCLGGGGFAGSSGQVTETVSPATPATVVVGAPSVAEVGQAVTLSATVSAVAPGTGLPTGSVDFLDSMTGSSLGSAPLV